MPLFVGKYVHPSKNSVVVYPKPTEKTIIQTPSVSTNQHSSELTDKPGISTASMETSNFTPDHNLVTNPTSTEKTVQAAPHETTDVYTLPDQESSTSTNHSVNDSPNSTTETTSQPTQKSPPLSPSGINVVPSKTHTEPSEFPDPIPTTINPPDKIHVSTLVDSPRYSTRLIPGTYLNPNKISESATILTDIPTTASTEAKIIHTNLTRLSEENPATLSNPTSIPEPIPIKIPISARKLKHFQHHNKNLKNKRKIFRRKLPVHRSRGYLDYAPNHLLSRSINE